MVFTSSGKDWSNPMYHIDNRTHAFTILHSELISSSPFIRDDDKTITFSLVRLDGTSETYCIPYHVKEHRPLVVLDGDIPTDGMPHQIRQLDEQPIGRVPSSPHHERKQHDFETLVPKPIWLKRRFLIIPQGSGVIMRYRPLTGARRYVLLKLTYNRSQQKWVLESQSTTF